MDIAKYIDHTFLKPQGTAADIEKLCLEAMEHKFYAVCVNSCWVHLCHMLLKGSDVKIAAVIGFPLGAMISEVKAFEAARAVEAGADELDMVINIGMLKSGLFEAFKADLEAVLAVCEKTTLLKVIIENCLLTQPEKIKACQLVSAAGAHFVKTSTGFNGEGATIDDVTLMREIVGPDFGVKAAGGVRTYDDAVKMIEAGATRIGTSGGVQIVSGLENTADY